MALDEYFSTGPERERPVFEAVHAHLSLLGPVHVEAVSVGLMFKTTRTFVELRPMVRWEALSFWLPHLVTHPRITRTVTGSGGRACHVVRLYGPDDVDDQVRAWLTESYLDSAP